MLNCYMCLPPGFLLLRLPVYIKESAPDPFPYPDTFLKCIIKMYCKNIDVLLLLLLLSLLFIIISNSSIDFDWSGLAVIMLC